MHSSCLIITAYLSYSCHVIAFSFVTVVVLGSSYQYRRFSRLFSTFDVASFCRFCIRFRRLRLLIRQMPKYRFSCTEKCQLARYRYYDGNEDFGYDHRYSGCIHRHQGSGSPRRNLRAYRLQICLFFLSTTTRNIYHVFLLLDFRRQFHGGRCCCRGRREKKR